MTIKQLGGVFGRNPTFNNVTIDGDLTVDGTVIHTARQLREHNIRNNVVNADEFSPEFRAKKAAERADFYEGRMSAKEKLARKQEIYEVMMRAERNG